MPNAADADVVVVGGGPAGLAAAAAAAEHGARVTLVDGASRLGGQYWRYGVTPAAQGLLHLKNRLAGVTVLLRHHVQTLAPTGDGWQLRCAVGDDPRAADTLTTLRGRRVVLATGAYDRQLPFPGWDLPGVLAAGGVQALLKAHGVPAGNRVVVAGTGPFLLPVAAGLLAAGARVPLVAEANSPAGFAHHPRALAGALPKIAEAARYFARLAATRTPYRRRHAVRRALGTDAVEAVEVVRLDRAGRPVGTRIVECDTLAVGWGFTAQLELHLQAGCATTVGGDGGLVVTADDTQRTTVDGVWAAGEATGVGGAQLAVVEGEIAGRSAAGAPADPRLAARRARLRRFAAALHAVHPVPAFLLDRLPGDTLVCRCEEVPAAATRDAVRDWGATDARTVKLLARPGMGWCQGRTCGYATACLTAHAAGRAVTHEDLRAFAERPLAVPTTLHTLAEAGGDE